VRGWSAWLRSKAASSCTYPVVEPATHALIVDPNLPFAGASVPTLAGVVPLVKSQRIIQSVQVVTVDVEHVVRTSRWVCDPWQYPPRLIANWRSRVKINLSAREREREREREGKRGMIFLCTSRVDISNRYDILFLLD